MRVEFEYGAEGRTFRGVAESTEGSFAKGVEVQILNQDGTIRDEISFGAHPAFDGYEEVELWEDSQRIRWAIERLNSGSLVAPMAHARNAGIRLLARINSPDSKKPNRALWTTQDSPSTKP